MSVRNHNEGGRTMRLKAWRDNMMHQKACYRRVEGAYKHHLKGDASSQWKRLAVLPTPQHHRSHKTEIQMQILMRQYHFLQNWPGVKRRTILSFPKSWPLISSSVLENLLFETELPEIYMCMYKRVCVYICMFVCLCLCVVHEREIEPWEKWKNSKVRRKDRKDWIIK